MGNDNNNKGGINPLIAGAIGAALGAAAVALSDKKTRDNLKTKVEELKEQGMKKVEEVRHQVSRTAEDLKEKASNEEKAAERKIPTAQPKK